MSRGDVSFPYLIGAALALVVLIVMIMIFTGTIGNIGKKYDAAAKPANTAAEKTGWCISTITQGKPCGYQQDCSGIGKNLGGSGKAVKPAEDACTGPGMLHAYSEKTGEFCCITVGS